MATATRKDDPGTVTGEFDPGPHKVEKPDPVRRNTNFFGSRRSMLNNAATDAHFPNSQLQIAARHTTLKLLAELPVHKRKERAKLEADLAANPLSEIWVVLDDELGQYATTVDRLDSGEVDPRRCATSRLGKLLGGQEQS